jgi:hypothetical protein
MGRFPQRLKPERFCDAGGTSELVPFPVRDPFEVALRRVRQRGLPLNICRLRRGRAALRGPRWGLEIDALRGWWSFLDCREEDGSRQVAHSSSTKF